MASWSRVAAGLQLVAAQAAKLAAADASTVAHRTAQHGYDAAASAAAAAAAASHPASILVNLRHNQPVSEKASSFDNDDFTATDLKASDPGDSSAFSDSARQQHQQQGQFGTSITPDRAGGQIPNKEPPPARTGVRTAEAAAEEFIHKSNHSSEDHRSSQRSDSAKLPSMDSPSNASVPLGHASSFEEAIQSPAPSPSPPSAPAASPAYEGDPAAPRLKEGRPVPSTRIGRAAGFAQLGVGLALGAAVEGVSRLLQPSAGDGPTESSSSLSSSSSSSSTSILVNDSNSDRLAESLCRMRGAALKMGQMLSIQDETLMPPALQRALVRVRQGAEAMPKAQLERQMVDQLGPHWRDRFVAFEDLPFAAASIGQVHRAVIVRESPSHNDSRQQLQNVVVKVQYPGVARSIRSDLRNLSMLVKWTGMAPPGLFIDNVIRVGEEELTVECDYRRELINQGRIKALVEVDPVLQENRFVVPDVVPDLSTDQILTSEFRPGGTIDKVTNLSQEERNRIGRTIMYLTMKELFVWRFMQTDPNWGNFLYDMGTGTTSLIDFGAAREYSKSFVDGYLRIVWASANRDEATLMKQSHRMNFLTGDETEQMIRAHKLSGYTVGEPFYAAEPFDFRGSNISTRMGEHTSVFLRHRLTPPPEEVYTLHRKLAGAYMLCIKLGAVIECRSLLHDIVANHKFEDGLEPLVV